MEEQAPFRHRHDGWTPERQLLFLARLAETGCVADACRAAGLSTTSARRAYKRMPEFAGRWDMALASPRPILEQAAFDRAVHGVEVGIHRNGKVVATHRKYSDGLLRYLLERDDKRSGRTGATRNRALLAKSGETAEEALKKQLDALAKRLKAEDRREALAFAERMRAEGKVP